MLRTLQYTRPKSFSTSAQEVRYAHSFGYGLARHETVTLKQTEKKYDLSTKEKIKTFVKDFGVVIKTSDINVTGDTIVLKLWERDATRLMNKETSFRAFGVTCVDSAEYTNEMSTRKKKAEELVGGLDQRWAPLVASFKDFAAKEEKVKRSWNEYKGVKISSPDPFKIDLLLRTPVKADRIVQQLTTGKKIGRDDEDKAKIQSFLNGKTLDSLKDKLQTVAAPAVERRRAYEKIVAKVGAPGKKASLAAKAQQQQKTAKAK